MALASSYLLGTYFGTVVLGLYASFVSIYSTRRIYNTSPKILWYFLGSVVVGSTSWLTQMISWTMQDLPFEPGMRYSVSAINALFCIALSFIALYFTTRSVVFWWHRVTAGLALFTMHTGSIALMVHSMTLSKTPIIDILWGSVYILTIVILSGWSLYWMHALRSPKMVQNMFWSLTAAGSMAFLLTVAHVFSRKMFIFPPVTVSLAIDELRGSETVVLVCICALILLMVFLVGYIRDSNNVLSLHSRSNKLEEDNLQLKRVAYTDPLTNLPNRIFFEDVLRESADNTNAEGFTTFFIDLDGFKPINDTWGHNVGDEVLTEVGERLGQCVGKSNPLARIGGDEFVILIRNTDIEQIEILANKIIVELQKTFNLPSGNAWLSCSIGISRYPQDGAYTQIISHADMAMYEAKSEGGSCFKWYKPEMEQNVKNTMALQHDLRKAIECDELFLEYQPKYFSNLKRMSGVEALVRWRHPTRGIISPVVFIPLAEQAGLIQQLGSWVLNQAIKQVSIWQKNGSHIPVAVNLSPHQLRNPHLIQEIEDALHRHSVAPQMLSLELTESSAMTNPEHSLLILNALKRLNIQLSIDDFGTGYSSLAYLTQFPLDQVKIDKSFVHKSTISKQSSSVIKAVVVLAHSLDMHVVAEGVETEEQAAFLRSIHVDELQGYLYGRPMPADEILQARNMILTQYLDDIPVSETSAHVWSEINKVNARDIHI